MWKDLFEDHILKRGLEYYRSNLVEGVTIKGNVIEATVFGTEDYEVEIVKADDEVISLGCTCPYAAEGNECKHMAAVLFYLENEGEALNREIIEPSIDKLVREADTVLIQNFLADALKNDEKLLSRFKSRLQIDLSSEDMKRYKNQINKIFRKYSHYEGFIDYENACELNSELTDFLDNEIQNMVNNNQLEEAFELTNYLFIELGNQDIEQYLGDFDDVTDEAGYRCLMIWQDIINNSSIEFKRKMFDWFHKQLSGSVVNDTAGYLTDVIFNDFEEYEFLEKNVIYLDKRIKEHQKKDEPHVDSNKIGNLHLMRISVMEEMKASQNEIEAYIKENLEFDQVRNHYIEICMNREDFELAIELLEEGKNKEKTRPGVVADYSFRLKDLYRKTGKDELYMQELWDLVLHYVAGNVEIYKELKSLYTDDQWIEKREVIFKKLAPYSGVDKLYAVDGLYDRLIELTISSNGLYLLEKYESILKDIYPKELLNKYENTVKAMAIASSKRGRYRDIVHILRRMQKYSEGQEKVSELVSEWKSKYKNRPAMMDELSKL